jgi:hypothetical protein
MTPQSTFMVLAPIADGRRDALEQLLDSMVQRGCMADPANAVLPFGEFERLHVARFVILDPQTTGDISVYERRPRPWRPALAFLGDCDGPAESFLDELAARAGGGLTQVFSHCDGFADAPSLRAFMARNSVRPAATYVNWIGRTVRQIREEAALGLALQQEARRLDVGDMAPGEIRERLLAYVADEQAQGRLTLTPEAETPPQWATADRAHAVIVPLLLLVASPVLLVASPLLLFMLRSRETSDPEIAPRVGRGRIRDLAAQEDVSFTNQFSAMGDVKPGLFRRWLVVVLLALLDFASRHVYRRGHLTRVQTIHFARWVLLDDKHRLFFASNYDGSLETYMDDFINKVAWGINVVFGNGVGFPRVAWLLKGGAKREQAYKRYLRRHQMPTQVWYKAYPDLTVADLNRHSRIRQGVEARGLDEARTAEWLGLL